MQLAQINGITTPGYFNNHTTLVGDLLSRFLLFAMSLSGIFFLVQLLRGGFAYMTAEGDSAKITSSTKTMTNATIGLILITTSYFLAQIIEQVFGIRFLL